MYSVVYLLYSVVYLMYSVVYLMYSVVYLMYSVVYLTVHDTENLTFSADDRAENPHISARTISGFRADNQRIPRGHLEDSARTISGFRAEFCGCNTQSNLLPA